jgi:hypothetical protein
MITAIFIDMKDFMVVFFITMIGFSQGMYILSNADVDYANPKEPNADDNPAYIYSFVDSIIFSYRMALGDFDTGKLGETYYQIAIIFFIIATLFLSVVMLNLLVAVISDTYARVDAESVSQMYKTMADLSVENEYLVPHSSLETHDKKGDYLYVAIVDSTNGDDNSVEA